MHQIIFTLACDTQLLRNLNIMDYSLLIFVEKVSEEQDLTSLPKSVFVSWWGNFVVHVAVIDYLQDWNLNK